MTWWDRIMERMLLSRSILSDVQASAWRIESKIDEMGSGMADVSQVLNDVAAGLRDNLGPRVAELVAENARLTARNAELEGEDAAESGAASNVAEAFNAVAGLFDQTEEAPTPDPIDVPPAPEGEDGSGSTPVGS